MASNSLKRFKPVKVNSTIVSMDEFKTTKDSGQRTNNHHFGTAATESAVASEFSHSGGGGGGMDEILKRLAQVESDLSNKVSKEDLRELGHQLRSEIKDQTYEIKETIQKSMEKVPSEDSIKNIIGDKSKNLGLATETFVQSEISKETIKMVLWMVGISITVATAASTILFNILKLVIK